MSMTLKYQRGINMIEVLVTIIITSIGLLGLNSLQLQANRATLDSGNRSQAVWLLEDLANRMYANQVGLDSYNTSGAAASCAAPAKICSAYHTLASRVAAKTDCTPAEQAASDLWEVACPTNIGGGNAIVFGSATDFIGNPELFVSINANRHVTLTLAWDVRTSGTDNQGNKVYTVARNINNTAILRDSITTEFQP